MREPSEANCFWSWQHPVGWTVELFQAGGHAEHAESDGFLGCDLAAA
jgi:hypothetical protein